MRISPRVLIAIAVGLGLMGAASVAMASGTTQPPAGEVNVKDAEIAELLHSVGWVMPDLETAVRIVLGESGGNAKAVNKNHDGADKSVVTSTDYGLFQLNDKAHPASTKIDVFDPRSNAVYAFGIYTRQHGFIAGKSAWNYKKGGGTMFHTRRLVKGAWVPDDKLIARARAAVAPYVGNA